MVQFLAVVQNNQNNQIKPKQRSIQHLLSSYLNKQVYIILWHVVADGNQPNTSACPTAATKTTKIRIRVGPIDSTIFNC